MQNPKTLLSKALAEAVKKTYGLDVEPEILPTPEPKFGDFSSNIAMQLARRVKTAPRQVAEALLAAVAFPEDLVAKSEIAGPGFINCFLSPRFYHEGLLEILANPETFGTSAKYQGKRAHLEYVSANPTGPIHMGNARSGAVGDVLANLMEAVGWEVFREYYINDAWQGTQLTNLGISVEVRFRQLLGEEVELPENAYKGDYIIDLAKELLAEHGRGLLDLPQEERLRTFQQLARDKLVKEQVEDLRDFGLEFDLWFSEQSLYDSGELEATLKALRNSGWTYEKDGALWLKSTAFGDDKDRVLVRQDGRPAYLASDLAYHRNKFERGFDFLLDIWGPHHHGYTQRVKAGLAALGYEADKLEFLIYQLVRLFEGGEMVKMSKRAGDLVPLRSVLDDIGRDATRFFFLLRAADSHLDFDLALARKQSDENPVYYVQYAHARLCSLEREARKRGLEIPGPSLEDLAALSTPTETALLKLLVQLPEVIENAAEELAPHKLTHYALQVADALHKFYQHDKILPEQPPVRTARFALARAARYVLERTLSLLGVAAPEEM